MRMKRWLVLLCFCVLTGCGFHLRQPTDLPTELQNISLQSNNVNDSITSGVRKELLALNASLDDETAPLVLTLSNSKSNADIPIVFNANADTNYIYHLSVTVTLKNDNGKTLHHSRVTASETVLHNVNQVSPPVLTPLMRSTLTNKLVDRIYELITSQQVLKAINDNT